MAEIKSQMTADTERIIGIGNEIYLKKCDIIAFFDADRITVSAVTKKLLAEAERSGRLVTAGFDIPKSLIICKNKDKNAACTLYFSKLSPLILKKRICGG